jgi:hypothetical protein
VTTNEQRLVLAAYTATTITVYHAYSPEIAEAAALAGTLAAPFSLQRMTWIKPSFGWMMHRCGWAHRPGQERVLAIGIRRAGFEWTLAHSCLSHFIPGTHDSREAWEAVKASSPVRVQWDPDRSLAGERLPRERSRSACPARQPAIMQGSGLSPSATSRLWRTRSSSLSAPAALPRRHSNSLPSTFTR